MSHCSRFPMPQVFAVLGTLTIANRQPLLPGQPIRNQVDNPWPGVSFMLNPGAFTDPKPYTLGNAARTYGDLRSFPWFQEDVSMTKQIKLTEGKRLELRVDAFNLLNRSIFNDPNTYVPDTPRIQGGRAVGYGSFWGRKNIERQMQASLRFIF